jgi:hypothetical protein
MRHPSDLDLAFWNSPLVQKNPIYVQKVREVLSRDRGKVYRGIGRCPFSESPGPDKLPGWEVHTEVNPDTELAARNLLDKFLGPYDYKTSCPRAFILELEQARLVYQALQLPEQYEVVELSTAPDIAKQPFGFDIGYWGGGDFSVLCDAAIWPRWHSPPPEAFNEILVYLQRLNSNALFADETSAQGFLKYYLAQEWAETEGEPGEFKIISVGAVEV